MIDKENNENLTTSANQILIVDSGADQCTVGGPAWVILHDTGNKIKCNGYLKGESKFEGPILPIVTAVTCVDINGESFLLMMNQTCFYDDEAQNESLCHPFQAMEHGVTFCLTPKEKLTPDGNPGLQKMTIDEMDFPLQYDGRKLYLNIRKPSKAEIENLEIFEVTSPSPYEPSTEPESNRRDQKIKHKQYPGGLTLLDWRKRLAMAPEDVIHKTFEATTQLAMSVEVENRMVPRQHYKSRFPFLSGKRLNDEFHSDTFYPSVRTFTNDTCSQLFFGKNTDYMYVQPLRSESHSFEALQDFGRTVGIPKCLKTDNARTEVGRKWTDWCRNHLVETKFTEPYHPWQNYSEQGIGELNRMVKRCMRMFDAPDSRHGYCQIWCARVRNSLASRKLKWRTPHEKLTGETPDISVFRFHFWQDVEYFDPTQKTPHDGWCRAKFLCINDSAGDNMTYILEVKSPQGKPSIITRSNVRALPSQTCFTSNIVLDSPSGEMSDIQEINNDDGEKITENEGQQVQNSTTTDNANNNDSNGQIKATMNEEQLEIDFGDDAITYGNKNKTPSNDDIDEHNSLIDQQIDQDDALIDQQINDTILAEEEDYEFCRITGHHWKEGELIFTVELTSGQTYETPFSKIKKDRPFEVAKYIRKEVIERKRGGRYEEWAKKVLTRAHRTIRRMHRSYNIQRIQRLDAYKEIKMRRISKNQREKKKKNKVKFGITVPNSLKHALILDQQNKNNAWAEAIYKEMSALSKAGVWEFKSPHYKTGKDYQYAPLTMIFDIKQEDLRRKARLVAGGHVVDSSMYELYSSVVQT